MLKVEKIQKGSGLQINLSGTIDEGDDLVAQIGQVTGPVEIDCRAVYRISSAGVRTWMKYFALLQTAGAKVNFEGFSSALVEQWNYIKNFNCGASVSSIVLPYQCESCDTHSEVLTRVEALKQAPIKAPPIKCPKCGSNADFDDLEESYFAFLTHLGG